MKRQRCGWRASLFVGACGYGVKSHQKLVKGESMLPIKEVIARDPEVLGGTPVFHGTRVPFQALLDYLEGGQTLMEFLDDFPTVTRDVAVSALEQGKVLLVSQLG
jgi:uncharacterized protein (DUF433 family)